MNPTPEVTVLMPVYNGMPFLCEAVDSILRQSLRDFAFLIIDDESNDGSEEYLDRLSDPRVRVVHESNRGPGAARNVGLAMCDSEFVAMMDSDDVAMPYRLETQLDFLRRHKQVGMVGTQIAYFGAGGRTALSPPMPRAHHEIYADLLRGRLAIRQPSLMCRTSLLKGIGGYGIDRIGEDFDMFLRMGEVSKIANLEDVLLLYRVHLGSATAKYTRLIRARNAHACYCARQRTRGLPEVTFDEFAADRPFLQRLADRMDCYAMAQYWRALTEILSSTEFKGYARLGWAAFCSPPRTWQRICRFSSKMRARPTAPVSPAMKRAA